MSGATPVLVRTSESRADRKITSERVGPNTSPNFCCATTLPPTNLEPDAQGYWCGHVFPFKGTGSGTSGSTLPGGRVKSSKPKSCKPRNSGRESGQLSHNQNLAFTWSTQTSVKNCTGGLGMFFCLGLSRTVLWLPLCFSIARDLLLHDHLLFHAAGRCPRTAERLSLTNVYPGFISPCLINRGVSPFSGDYITFGGTPP